jgi:uncharacterized protein
MDPRLFQEVATLTDRLERLISRHGRARNDMSDQKLPPEQAMASLFRGLSRREQMALLAKLEIAGGAVYRALAANESNAMAREKLLKAAEDEERNGGLLRLMTTPKERCEKCGAGLTNHQDGYACSFQCTFCESCASGYSHVCPNCSGSLSARAGASG